MKKIFFIFLSFSFISCSNIGIFYSLEHTERIIDGNLPNGSTSHFLTLDNSGQTYYLAVVSAHLWYRNKDLSKQDWTKINVPGELTAIEADSGKTLLYISLIRKTDQSDPGLPVVYKISPPAFLLDPSFSVDDTTKSTKVTIQSDGSDFVSKSSFELFYSGVNFYAQGSLRQGGESLGQTYYYGKINNTSADLTKLDHRIKIINTIEGATYFLTGKDLYKNTIDTAGNIFSGNFNTMVAIPAGAGTTTYKLLIGGESNGNLFASDLALNSENKLTPITIPLPSFNGRSVETHLSLDYITFNSVAGVPLYYIMDGPQSTYINFGYYALDLTNNLQATHGRETANIADKTSFGSTLQNTQIYGFAQDGQTLFALSNKGLWSNQEANPRIWIRE